MKLVLFYFCTYIGVDFQLNFPWIVLSIYIYLWPLCFNTHTVTWNEFYITLLWVRKTRHFRNSTTSQSTLSRVSGTLLYKKLPIQVVTKFLLQNCRVCRNCLRTHIQRCSISMLEPEKLCYKNVNLCLYGTVIFTLSITCIFSNWRKIW